MKLRILTAVVLIPPVLYVLHWAPLWVFLLVLLAVVGRNVYEYLSMVRQMGTGSLPVVAYATCGALCVGQCVDLRDGGVWVPALLGSALLVTMSLAVFLTKDLKQYLGAVSSTILGILYVGFTLSCLVPLGFDSHIGVSAVWALSGKTVSTQAMGALAGAKSPGRDVLLFLFLIIWADDAFAYFVGRAVGRTPLFPRISPKKTVEGSVGGLLGSILTGWAFAQWKWPGAGWWRVILLAALIAVAGQVGDLVESALKRGSNVKDSGTLLPGHGGLLDRMDSLLFATPALWSMLALRDFFAAQL
jgi:phosphatidate cytidylyltransferase